MTTADRTLALAKAIATAIVDNMKKTLIQVNVTNEAGEFLSIECDYQWGPNYCQQCLLLYTDQATLDTYREKYDADQGTFDKVTKLQATVCQDVCTCEIDVAQSLYVSATPPAITPPSTDDIDDMVNQILTILNDQQPVPSKSSIQDIINNMYSACPVTGTSGSDTGSGTCTTSDKSAISVFSAINQALLVSQVVSINGVGNVKNVKMSTLVTCVMQAIIGSSIDLLQQAINDSVESLKEQVTTATQQTIKEIWIYFRNQWIALFVVAGLSVVLWMITLIVKSVKHL